MSNHGKQDQGKRGFVRPQQSRPPVKATPADWAEAKAAADAAQADDLATFEASMTEAELDAAAESIDARYDRLFSTPAHDGEALAYKLGLFGSVFLDFDPRDRNALASAANLDEVQFEDRRIKALVTCYLDALALSGVSRPAAEDEKPATIPEAAAVDFEAWPADKLQTYTPQSWAELWNPWGISLAIASNVMGQSKAELTKLAKDTGALTHEGGQFYELAQSLQRTREAFSDAVTMLQAAELRMMIAAAAANVAAGYVEEGE